LRVHRSFFGAVAAFLVSCLAAGAAGISINDNNTHIDRGVLYTNSAFLSATGGTAPYSFVVNSGLPPGIVVNSAGQVSGATCGSNGNFGLSVTVTDNVGGTATATNKSLIVNAAPAGGCSINFTSSAPTSTANVGQPYSFSFATSGGSVSTSYSVGSGSVPTGLSLSSSGTLSGTPTTQGTYTFSIWASDGTNTGSSANYTITVGAALAGAPVVSSLSPTSGPATGGTSVTLTGTGFTGTTGVTFGGTAATGVAINSDTSLTVTTPAKATGAVTVAVTNGFGTGSLSSAYTYVQASQTITFANPGAQTYGTTPTLSATASSGLTVSFSSATTGVCTITSGGALTFLTAGTCTINADQAGNATYLAATQAQQSFTVNAVVPGAPTIGTATAGTGQASISFTAPASTGGASITGYTVTSSPGGFTGSGSSSPIVVTGLTNGVSYTFTVTATNSAGTGSASAASNAVTPRASQTITFNDPGSQSFGTAPTLSATSDSGLTVAFTSATTGVCTITSGGTLTFVTTGTCTIYANQAGDGIYLPASQAQRSFTVAPVAPDAPTIGTATEGDGEATITFSAPSGTGGASITGYTVTSSPGGFTGTGSSSPITVTGLTNGVSYTFTVTATNSAGTGSASAASNAVTPKASQTITFANPGTQTYGTTPTLTATSDSGLTVSFSSATTGVCTITSGGALTFVATGTCIIEADQAGDGAFLAATTAQRSFTVSPVVPDAPTIGTATAGDGEASVTFTAPANTGGASITGYTVTSSPGGITETGSSSPIVVSGLTNGTAYTFTVTATTSAGTGAASSPSNQVTPVAAAFAPIAGAASATVAANSSANPVTLALTGGAATSVAIDTAASHGTASASGTSITYTPDAGYSGSDSFQYTATNGAGTSSAATVTITVSQPTLVLNLSGALPGGTVGTAYSQTISASAGGSPYSYAVTAGALPAGLSLNTSTGALTGTPTTDGAYNFTITATDTYGAIGSESFSLTVDPVAAPSLVFTPSGGTLPAAMAGEHYSQAISASGGSGSLLYSLDSGTLPQGMILNVSTGALSGPLDANATVGDYSFTLRVTDAGNASATASFTLHVNPRTVTVTDKTVSVSAGNAPANVDLAQEATGGPFTAAELVSVSPPNAGTIEIVNGEFAQVGPVGNLGWYLKFIPNPAYKGQVTVSFRLTSALGVSNLGVVYYNVAYDPEEVAVNVDTLVHGFVQTRQNLIANAVAVPGLLERRRMAEARTAFTGRVTPGENGLTAMFATSLAQMEAARNLADGVTAKPSAFNAWVNGTVMLHEREQNGGNWGSFAMLSAGADYLINERALIGLSLHYDRMTDPTDEDARLTGNGWLAGPYGSFEVADGIYWDTSLLYGGSSNDIDTSFWDGRFDTSRWLLDTSLKGRVVFGDGGTLTPTLRALYMSETVKDYAVDNADGDVMELKGFTTDQLRLSFGADYSRDIPLGDGAVLTPRVGFTAGFSGLDGSGAFGSLSAGLSYAPTDDWNVDLGLLVGIEGDGQTSAGGKIGLTGRF